MRQYRKTEARTTEARTTDQRPLTARSVVASTLLGLQPPVLSGRLLVRSGELFDINEGTTRVALSRMVATGELEVDDGRYRLTGRLLDRQARQEASRRAGSGPWDGEWRTAIVTADRRSSTERAELRRAMVDGRFAELREGVWTRPDNLGELTGPVAGDSLGGQCTWFRGRPDSVDGTALAARLWDVRRWADRAQQLRASMTAAIGPLRAGDTSTLASGFVLSAAVLRHLQVDPLLPDALLPRGWPGRTLRREYDRYDAAYRRLWRTAFGSPPQG